MPKTNTKLPHGVEEKHIGIGLTMGVAAGVVVGSITGEMGFWVAMGCSAGLVLGLLVPTLLDALRKTMPSGPKKPDS